MAFVRGQMKREVFQRVSVCDTLLAVTRPGGGGPNSEDSVDVGAIGLALEPLVW